MKKSLLPLLLIASAAGCGGNPVSFSEPVDITLQQLQSKDYSSGAMTISVSKDVRTANGNPYGAFITAAQQHLGGKNPSRIVITSLTLSIVTSPAGLAFDQVFTGAVTISFQMVAGSNNTYQVGAITNPSGTGPVSLTVAFDSGAIQPGDYTSLLNGQFNVVLTGTATSGSGGFNNTNTNETATIDAIFGFVAYE